ncbi:MAG TPA: GNAT family N-acetyltransferase [Dermatophilaceae bacterium]|nr:GNAT family N-acetyltransferase [Dermatophilaceae bacterium]
MSAPPGTTTTRDNPDEKRYEGWVDGALAGYTAYRTGDDVVVFTHTVVEPIFEGRGVGSAIVRHALDEVRADGTRRVVPECSFVRSWMDRHVDYQPLLHPGSAGRPA